VTDPGDAPLYESPASARSLWQAYRVFADRIELDLHLWGVVRVPFAAVHGVEVRPAGVIFDLFRGKYGLGELMRAPKFDLADLAEHVVIEKDGFWRQVRITPDDPAAFVEAFRRAHEAWKRTTGAG
jgi:hypothetical protein